MSFTRIACPLDFSDVSYEALKSADRLAQRTGAELLLIHVISLPVVNGQDFEADDTAFQARQEACEHLRQIIATRLSHLGKVRFVVRFGDSVEQTLVDIAREKETDIIVIGTHGLTGWRRLVLGSVTDDVMRLASCPVLTVRSCPGDFIASQPITSKPRPKILAPTDFSAPSLQAVEKAGEVAMGLGAELSLLYVMEPMEPVLGIVTVEEFNRERSSEAVQVLLKCIDKHLAPEAQAATKVKPLLRTGQAAAEIVRAVVEENFDLIVMATHGETGWRHFLHGSVTEEVVRTSLCPVLTIHPQPEENQSSAKSCNSQTCKDNDENNESILDKAKPSIGEKRLSSVKLIAENQAEFPLSGSATDKLSFLLRYAVLAPSNRNTQPWRWHLTDDGVELYTDRTRSLPHLDPNDRELTLSCGTALMHLRLAIRHFGYQDEVALLPISEQPDLLASVRLGPEYVGSTDEHLLFEAISQRHTNRQPFTERDLSATLKVALESEARQEGARLLLIESTRTRLAIINVIARADQVQGRDARWVQENALWVRGGGSRDRASDGIPEQALGKGGLLSFHATDVGVAQGDKDTLLAWSAPVLAILQTEDDTRRDWLCAGQALSRILLRAAASGVQASFFNSPIEVAAMWPQLHQLLSTAGLPQMIFRLGYPSQETVSTPRRAVSEVTTVSS